MGRRLAVDPEWEVAGLAVVVGAEVGTEETGPDPGFRSIDARLSRGAYNQLSASQT